MSARTLESTAEGAQSSRTVNDTGPSPVSPSFSETKEDYQDKTTSHDSRLKALFDEQLSGLKEARASYSKAAVLLLSWHPECNDLNTEGEVNELEAIFRKDFKFQTHKEELTQDIRKSAQNQINYFLARFVHNYDDVNTLLIVYYAGHGKPGKSLATLILEGRKSLLPNSSSNLHEVEWNAAEQIINNTRGDVLAIFDCCYAGELEVRSSLGGRTFEYMAATSANSTTRSPGPHSFTTALIWALKRFIKSDKKRIPTQELLTEIMNCPHFPHDQVPRLHERGRVSNRKIVLAPINSREEADATVKSDEGETQEGIRQDLTIRFAFNQKITEPMVLHLAQELRRVISMNDDFKSTDVLWDGIQYISRGDNFRRFANTMISGKRWLHHHRKKSGATLSPMDAISQNGYSGPPVTHGNVAMSAEKEHGFIVPEIVGEKGSIAVTDKLLRVDTGHSYHTAMSSPTGLSPSKRKSSSLVEVRNTYDSLPPRKRSKQYEQEELEDSYRGE
ncbi:hypothetical protein B0J14DRAFT_354256 [Halenospora varia]|nr:hypothetical protein B0J14DRAFT_354256 [Halenospora varia]